MLDLNLHILFFKDNADQTEEIQLPSKTYFSSYMQFLDIKSEWASYKHMVFTFKVAVTVRILWKRVYYLTKDSLHSSEVRLVEGVEPRLGERLIVLVTIFQTSVKLKFLYFRL